MKEKISVKDFVSEFKARNIKNDRITPHAIEDYVSEKLDIITYIPFTEKYKIAKMVVENNMTEEYNVKRIDRTSEFVGFVVSMLEAHTNLTTGTNPVEDYDALSESGLLEYVIATFQKDYQDCSTVLQMVRDDALAENNLSAVVGKFLDEVLDRLDDVGDALKGVIEKVDLDKMMNMGLNENEMAKVKSLLNKYIK